MLKTYFVAHSLMLWGEVKTSLGTPMAAKMDNGSVGFLPVYETAEEARAAHPTCRIIEVQTVEQQQDATNA